MVIYGLRKTLVFFLLILLVISVVSNQFNTTNASTFNQLENSVTLDLYTYPVSTNTTSNIATNLYLGLADIDPVTAETIPQLATSWEHSDDLQIWTFHLRDDVSWVRYDADSEAVQAVRPVVADDFVYTIQRACDPRWWPHRPNDDPQTSMFSNLDIIVGCQEVFQTPTDELTDDLVYGDTVRVVALNDYTLEFELDRPAIYFQNMITSPVFWANARENYELDSRDDLPLLNGHYIMATKTEVRARFVRNPLLPEDLWVGNGNIDVVNYTINPNYRDATMLYDDDLIDMVGVSNRDMLQEPSYQNQQHFIQHKSIVYFGFSYAYPPFDNVHYRRAFRALVNPEDFTNLTEQAISTFGYAPIGQQNGTSTAFVGSGFDPDYANEQLRLGGLEDDCLNFPAISIVTDQNFLHDYFPYQAHDYLDCYDLFGFFNTHVYSSEVATLAMTSLTPYIDLYLEPPPVWKNRMNIWLMYKGLYYNDPHNFYEVLSCHSLNHFQRPCNHLDELIDQAAIEPDPAIRREVYAEIEEGFFGVDGEVPAIPLYTSRATILAKPWLRGPFETDNFYGGLHWDAYTVDMETKLAAHEN